MTNSRQKGKRGELDAVKWWHFQGYIKVRRGQQYSGANGDADIVGADGLHIEVKRRNVLKTLYEWVTQAQHDKKPTEKPVVMFRADNSEWLMIMPANDWIDLYREYETPTQKADRIYNRYCNGCYNEKYCHEHCIRCEIVSAIHEWEGI